MRVDITPFDTATFDTSTKVALITLSEYEDVTPDFTSWTTRLEDVSQVKIRPTDSAVVVHHESGISDILHPTVNDVYVEGVKYDDLEELRDKLTSISCAPKYIP